MNPSNSRCNMKYTKIVCGAARQPVARWLHERSHLGEVEHTLHLQRKNSPLDTHHTRTGHIVPQHFDARKELIGINDASQNRVCWGPTH